MSDAPYFITDDCPLVFNDQSPTLALRRLLRAKKPSLQPAELHLGECLPEHTDLAEVKAFRVRQRR